MKKSVIIFIVGIIITVFPYFFNTYSLYRLLIMSVGIFICTLSLLFKKQRNIFFILVLPIILILLTYTMDTFLFLKFDKMPIYVYRITSSDKVKIYNSFFYRIYDCDGTKVPDYGYEKSYVCKSDDLDTKDINEFLLNPTVTYNNYQGKFVRIHGKISKITGIESIEMATYENVDNAINGYVNFNLDNKLRVNTDSDLTGYRIYDYIDVIGLVDEIIKEENTYTIVLKDTHLIKNDIYDNPKFVVYSDKEKKHKEFANNCYYYGIKNIDVLYDKKNKYDFGYLITDNRINIESLIKGKTKKELKNNQEEVIANVYSLDMFNVVDCNGNFFVLTDNKTAIKSNICSIETE